MKQLRHLIFFLLIAFPFNVLAERPDDLFPRLWADPKEIQSALKLDTRVGDSMVSSVILGDYFHLIRWNIGDRVAADFKLGGGVFARFGFPQSTYLDVVDFEGNLPLDIAAGPWKGQVMFHHTSSHLGDDYIRIHQIEQPATFGWETLRGKLAYELPVHLLLYGGYEYQIHGYDNRPGRHGLQTGFQWQRPGTHFYGWYWSGDLQASDHVHWNPAYSTEVGVHLRRSPEKGEGLAFFLEFLAGPSAYGQFFDQTETLWGIGMRLGLPVHN